MKYAQKFTTLISWANCFQAYKMITLIECSLMKFFIMIALVRLKFV